VLLEEVLEWLRISPDGTYIDATLGAGGHSEAIANAADFRQVDQAWTGTHRRWSWQGAAEGFGEKVRLVQSRVLEDCGGPRKSWAFRRWTGSWPTWDFRACS